MPIAFSCACGKQLRAQDNCAGQPTKCPACGQPLTVPPANQSAQPIAAKPTSPPPAAWVNEVPTLDLVRKGNPMKKYLLAGGLALGAVLAVAAGWSVLGGKSSTTDNNTEAGDKDKQASKDGKPSQSDEQLTTITPDGYAFRMPVPGYNIPMDVSVWKGHFQIKRIDYEKDMHRLVFLLQTDRPFAFTDDGFTAPMRFYDADSVSMVEQPNLKFEHNITTLQPGERTRLYLTLPDDEILKKTKSAKAVLKGFFTKDK
ncbi:MAG: hypothetical protein AB7K24_03525 [Gemmataceae bacterium]